ncbi:NADPH:quinone reductase-like Zn-dependent oxidoreductase [Pacificibacter maritimus]|uniref:enoyl-[acyl-carrier-protein] reductase n=1 Tax=Pacificibacter maritimus TaxID=762213 RepID=A0A3N4UJJ3_9RHOB|nr:zinc-binding dehydrogenase [Pacificibacter maritimus]RPE67449.1 NADPH:quinone reductase-like Zn-dependent oxidoreductase [Pacificibacter maritimus]
MKSATHSKFGDPVEVMQFAETTAPVAQEGEVLIRTILSPIHNHDLWTVRGDYGYKPELPAVGGTEAVGIVEAVGAGVDDALIGKRVAAAGIHGTWAEKFTAPAQGVVPLPDAIPDDAAAQLIAMPFSAISLLDFITVSEGDWIVQTAANGAVGKVFAALAEAKGFKTLNLVRRQDAVAELEALGMTNVISTDQDGWKDQAKAVIGEAGATAAVDSVGGSLAEDLVDLLGWEGQLITFGTATGAPLTLNSGMLIFKHITLKGFWGAKVSEHMAPEKRVALITELATLAAQGKLPLSSGGDYALEDVKDAMKAAQVTGRAGKVMLRP